MDTKLFERFAPVIRKLSDLELGDATTLSKKLLLASKGNIDVCYVPFEHVNRQAKVVIVGITPGKTQMLNAIAEARRQLDKSADFTAALISAKRTGAFSGTIRQNLVNLLDFVGLNHWLKISTCQELFGSAAHLVQTTSVLRNPVFINGENYNGTPSMINNSFLQEQILLYFGEEAKALPKAVFVPLGDKVAEALHFLAAQGLISRSRILDGLPHPSGANAERIAYFLRKKQRAALSAKTNPDKIDKVREEIIARVAALK